MKRIIPLMFVLLFTCCKSIEYVPVVTVEKDTVRLVKVEKDSIHVHDSTIIQAQGDTIYFERWHTRYRDRWRTDTIYKSRVDSIPYPVVQKVEVEVERELTPWQRFRMSMGNVFLILIGLTISFFIMKR